MKPETLQQTLRASLLIGLALVGQTTTQEPVGLLLGTGPDAEIVRRSAKTPLPARAGEMLFAGDRLRTGSAPASFLYCPGRASQTLGAGSEALLDAAEVKIERGKQVSRQPAGVCLLPPVVELGVASRQHAGGLVLRDVPPAASLKLVSPVGSPILDTPPKFVWAAKPEADTYLIEVANATRVVIWRTELGQTEIQYPGHAPPLVAPSFYYWRVTASAAGKPIAATESAFTVLRPAERSQLRQQLAETQSALDKDPANPALRLAKATRLERAGLLSQAVEDYQALPPAWKDHAWLKEKLAQLEQALRAAQRDALAAQ